MHWYVCQSQLSHLIRDEESIILLWGLFSSVGLKLSGVDFHP